MSVGEEADRDYKEVRILLEVSLRLRLYTIRTKTIGEESLAFLSGLM